MLLPIGIDDARVSRVPWISIALVAVNVLAFLGSWVFASGDRQLDAAWEETQSYWAEHPYLDVPPTFEERFDVSVSALRSRFAKADRSAPAPVARAAEQERLDGLCLQLLELSDRQPMRRFALVPARGARQPGWITHLFLHAGWGHLLGNMLVFFLVVAPFLEDVWGRPFFLGFYLTGGLFAALCQALPDPTSQVSIVGASGAIMACVGAFTVRFATRRVQIFYWVFLFLRGTFRIPAWSWGLLGLGVDLLGLRLGGVHGGVAYAAHVGGFAFGFGVALALQLTRAERTLSRGGAEEGWSLHPNVEKAMAAAAQGRLERARALLEDAIAKQPNDLQPLTALVRIELDAQDRLAALRALDRLLSKALAAGDREAVDRTVREFWDRIDLARLRPAVTSRVAEALGPADWQRAERLWVAASDAGGALGARALLRAAQLHITHRERLHEAHALAERAGALAGIPPDLARRAREVAEEVARMGGHAMELPEEHPAGAGRQASDTAWDPRLRLAATPLPVNAMVCRLGGIASDAIVLVAPDGRRARLHLARVRAVAVGQVQRFTADGDERAGILVTDLVVRAAPGGMDRVVRLPSHRLDLRTHFPQLPPPEAYRSLLALLLAGSNAASLPSRNAVLGKPYAGFENLAAFEAACYGS